MVRNNRGTKHGRLFRSSTTLDRRHRNTSNSSSSSSSSSSSLGWMANSVIRESPLSSIELSPGSSSGNSSKGSSCNSWSEWKCEELEVDLPRKRTKVAFDTPRFSISNNNQLSVFEYYSNEEKWTEFKNSGGTLEGHLRPRIPIIKALLPHNRDSDLNALYALRTSIQCPVCGIRFPLAKRTTDYAKHLDFHFLMKSFSVKRYKSGVWYPSLGTFLESDANFEFENMCPKKKESDEATANCLPSWEYESKHCELCLEPFEQEFRNGECEGWYLINVIIKSSGGMVHPGCL